MPYLSLVKSTLPELFFDLAAIKERREWTDVWAFPYI